MKYTKLFIALIVSTALAVGQEYQGPEEPTSVDYEPAFILTNGQNAFHRGNFGNIKGRAAASGLLQRFAPLLGEGSQLQEVADKTDELGQRHVRVQQYMDGLPVIGSEMIVHADRNGDVFAINGRFGNSENTARSPKIQGRTAMKLAMAHANIRNARLETNPTLAYVVGDDGAIFLAWEAYVRYTNEEGEQYDRIFADATNGQRAIRHPQHHYVRNRRTYSANNGTSLPGSLVRSEGSGNSGDTALDAAHNYAGVTYDYYYNKFGRDSYNGSGAVLTSTVHYSRNYNNAFWNGSQMVYGDGDGTTFAPLSQSLDVVGHELTHAVTEYSSNLVYSYESGALNEAMSDIFGACIEADYDGSISANTWKLGEDIYTPGTAGDALRYMNDPQAGGDYDYYPTRYTGSQDNGGVHWNSGIANLAFYLLTMGGTHPRGATSNTVPGIGMDKAAAIFYRANTVYLTSNAQFEDARNATASAAADLYGQAEVNAVHEAWNAVGVPGGSGGGGGGGGDCTGYSETFNGSLSGTGQQSFQPNGTYWYDGNGDTRALLQGPSGTDFDLYLWKWSSWYGWQTVAQSLSASSTESIDYNGSAGYYVYRVYSYSGSGSYQLCVDR